jgi:hypothetical protein
VRRGAISIRDPPAGLQHQPQGLVRLTVGLRAAAFSLQPVRAGRCNYDAHEGQIQSTGFCHCDSTPMRSQTREWVECSIRRLNSNAPVWCAADGVGEFEGELPGPPARTQTMCPVRYPVDVAAAPFYCHYHMIIKLKSACARTSACMCTCTHAHMYLCACMCAHVTINRHVC